MKTTRYIREKKTQEGAEAGMREEWCSQMGLGLDRGLSFNSWKLIRRRSAKLRGKRKLRRNGKLKRRHRKFLDRWSKRRAAN